MEAVKFLRSTHFSRQTFLGKTFDIFHAFSALHNVLFEQYDSPVSATLIPDVDTGQDIADSEFGIHSFLENHVFHPCEQPGTNVE